MRKFMTTCLILALSLNFTPLRAGELDKVFDSYKGKENVTTVDLTKGLLDLAAKFMGEDDKELKEVLESIDVVRVLTTEEASVGKKLYAEAQAAIKGDKYEELIRVKEEDEDVSILIQEDGKLIKNLVVLVNEPSESVLLNIRGNIDINKVSELLEGLDIDVDVNIDDVLSK